MARDVMVRSAHFGLIPLMVAQSLLVLTTGRLFCSRYVDTLPVRIVRCPVPFPPLTYYQLWHELTHASPAVRWLREQVRDVARNLRRPRHAAPRVDAARDAAAASRMSHRDAVGADAPPARGAAIALRGDLLDFIADAGLGRGRVAAVRFRPDHWLLIEDGRIAGVAGRAARRRLAAPRPPRPADPARLHRHPRAHARSST